MTVRTALITPPPTADTIKTTHNIISGPNHASTIVSMA